MVGFFWTALICVIDIVREIVFLIEKIQTHSGIHVPSDVRDSIRFQRLRTQSYKTNSPPTTHTHTFLMPIESVGHHLCFWPTNRLEVPKTTLPESLLHSLLTWKLSEPYLFGFLWKLHYISVIDFIIGHRWLNSVSNPFLLWGQGDSNPLIMWLVLMPISSHS